MGPKNALLGINTLEFVKDQILSDTVSFGVGSAFLKDPGPAFSQGLGSGPGPGRLSKVCPFRTPITPMLVPCEIS